MKREWAIAVACLALSATTANAASLISASVTGPSGTVWDTAAGGFYTLFLQENNGPGSPVINPTPADLPINISIDSTSRFLLTGDGWPIGGVNDSDSLYTLTLNFLGGATLTGNYAPATNTFSGGSSAVIDGAKYSLDEFSWRRFLGDPVQPYYAVPGGDANDYNGNFRLSMSAVPEPTTWALMILGIGGVGAMMRRRTKAAVRYAF